jgi:hypothetical protein
MTDLTPIADKLSKLIRMLSSDRDGEIVAAVHGIRRTLQGAGCDIHDLANAITKPATKGSSDRAKTNGNTDKTTRTNGGHQQQHHKEADWHSIARACQANPNVYRGEREREFINDMVRRAAFGGDLSEKQKKWLLDIYSRII